MMAYINLSVNSEARLIASTARTNTILACCAVIAVLGLCILTPILIHDANTMSTQAELIHAQAAVEKANNQQCCKREGKND
jgi:hypothetical protein